MSKSLFTRGYKECSDRLSKNSQFSRSCFNCQYFYQASGDKEEVCQNESVLEYDMVINNNIVYCLKWKQLEPKKNILFKKKLGRNILD